MSEQTQRLSEGYDFIEESCGYMPLDFSEAIDAPIVESESGTPFKVIGKACGPFQPMGEMSRNNRLYEADHWDYQLENLQFQERIKSRDLLGTIGHYDKKVDDKDISEGLVSHIVTCLEKREDAQGRPYLYGELEILDTKAGRNLKALYEGGANLYVSSRGAGKLLPVPNQTYKKVDKNSYFCETFDVVRRPGFLKAKPMFEQVQESASVSEAINAGKINSILEKLDESKGAPMNEGEVAELKGQVEKLAKILEKVVDDMYEAPEEAVVESIDSQLARILFSDDVSEEAYEDITSILSESNKEFLDGIMENSRKKFNAENAEKSGLEISHYRFGGKKPYKVHKKGECYFSAPLSSPTFRTLKQAQKYVLDSSTPKEETVKESIKEFASLMAKSNISEEAFSEVIEMIRKGIK